MKQQKKQEQNYFPCGILLGHLLFFFTSRLEIFQFHFFITTEIYQSSEKKMISHQTSEKKSMSVHNNFL